MKTLLLNWYGDPLTETDAQLVARLSKDNLDKYHRKGRASYAGIMMQMVADWWLHEANSSFPMRGMFYANSKRKLALYHLVAGQLMMSCRLQPAMDYLDMGLRHADGLLSSEAYFELYNRHEELRFLNLYPERQKPRRLKELLNESRVMRKLAPHSRYSVPNKLS